MKIAFRLFIVALCLMWAGNAMAYKPAVHKINGIEMAFNYNGEILFDGSLGRSLEPLLAGVALNTPAEPLSERGGKITALKHHEIVGHDGCVINLQILPFGSKGNVFICTGIPITKFAMQCSLLRTTYRNGHLVILIHIQGDIIHHYELNIP